MADNSKTHSTFYEKSPYYKGLIKRSLQYLETGFPVHFTGPSGIGKTTLALHIAKQRKKPVTLIHGNKELSNQELIGAFSGYKKSKLKDNYVRTVYKLEENVTESWSEGRLLEAVKKGCTLVYDEFTRSRPEVNNVFLSILEERILPLYGTKQKKPFEKVHPDFAVIFTSNPLEYAGVYHSQDALLDRMVTLPLKPMDKESETAAVISRTGIQEEQAGAIVEFITKVRELCTAKQEVNGLGLRASIMIAEMAKRYQIPIDGSNEEFVQLCFDIAFFPLKGCMDKSDERIRRQLKDIAQKVQGKV